MVNNAVAAAEAIPADRSGWWTRLPRWIPCNGSRHCGRRWSSSRNIESTAIPSAWAGSSMRAMICIRIFAKTYYNRFGQLLFAQAQGASAQLICRSCPQPRSNGRLRPAVRSPERLSHHDGPERQSIRRVAGSDPIKPLGRRRNVDAQSMQLAQKQFVFYAKDLKNGNPFSSTADDDAVARGRVLSGPVFRHRAGVSVHAVPGRRRRP